MSKKIVFSMVASCAVLISLPSFLSSKEKHAPVEPSEIMAKQRHADLSQNHSATIAPLSADHEKKNNNGGANETSRLTDSIMPTQPSLDSKNLETLDPSGSNNLSSTSVIITAEAMQLKDKNRKPQINLSIQQSIQNEINQWVFTENSPVNYSIDITGLFEDSDGDLLTTQVAIDHSAFSISNQSGNTRIQGTPKSDNPPTTIKARAKDDYHGAEQHSWVTTSFQLPLVNAGLEDDKLHPLVGSTWYRLETSRQFSGKKYNYEVVYCEAFKFINDDVFFASSRTLTTCPTEKELRLVGNYHVSGNRLVVASYQSIFDEDMEWTILKEYPASPHYSTAYVASVKTGKHSETYTLGSSRNQIEQRINTITGQYSLQMTPHDYMYLAKNGRYYLGVIGMHLSNYQQSNPTHPDTMDGDLNIQSQNTNVLCHDLLSSFNHISVAGKGVYGDVIGQTVGLKNEPIECDKIYVPQWQKHYSFFDVDFLSFDEFKDGEIFSIILRPKAELAHKVEEIKMNVRYVMP